MSPKELDSWKIRIGSMSHYELAHLWRFASSGHVIFSTAELLNVFTARFESFGGMTPEISKEVGWELPILGEDK